MTTICRFPRPGRSAPADLTELPSYDETYATGMPGDGSLILSGRAPPSKEWRAVGKLGSVWRVALARGAF
jgi:hypothetical protein